VHVDVRRTLPRHLLWALGILVTVAQADMLGRDGLGQDAHAYWAVWQGDWRTDVYDIPPAQLDAFNYSPVFALLVWPLAQLPWPVFAGVWTALCLAALVWLLRPLGWRWVPPLVLCASPEVLTGNVFWALAVVAALGTVVPRPGWAAVWSFAVLTKITPALGPLWHLARGEWRAVAAAAGTTLVLVAGTWLVVPDLWQQWLAFLLDHEASGEQVGSQVLPPLAVRLPLAVVLVLWGGRTGRAWTVPVGMVLATPVASLAVFVMLAALPRIRAAADARAAGSAGDAPSADAEALHERL